MSSHSPQSRQRSNTPNIHSTFRQDNSLSPRSDTSPASPTLSPRSHQRMSSGSSNPTVQSRRSHTKSRLGCKTCKRRHIRCDETSPQCRNCTKHNVRCDYMETALADGAPNLRITPQVHRELEIWRQNSVFPFPSLGLDHPPSPQLYNTNDLRLLHHVASIADDMQAVDPSNRYALWTRRIPMFLRIAAHNPFVMHSLLGFSASHLSYLTGCKNTQSLTYRHRDSALQGLQQALGKFNKENADAVLAASILLSWQVTDWRSWASLLQGTGTVIDNMQAWSLRYPSEFTDLMDEKQYFQKMSGTQAIPDESRDRLAVNHVYHKLMSLRNFFGGMEDEVTVLDDLIHFVGSLYERIPVFTEDEQFLVLQPLRTWLFFLPIDFLRRGRSEVHSMVLLSHFFAVALAIEPLFPAVGAAYLGIMSVAPIEQIERNLRSYNDNTGGRDPEVYRALHDYMAFPREMVHDFRARMSHLALSAQIAASPTARHPVVIDYAHMSHRGSLYGHPSSPQDLSHHWQPLASIGPTSDGISSVAYPISPYDKDRSQPSSNYIAQAMWNQMR